MEDNDGYSFGERVDEIIKRKKISVNGKELHLPRKISDRIFSVLRADKSVKRIVFEDGEAKVKYFDRKRYKPSALSRYVSDTIRNRYLQDFNEQFREVESEKGHRLDPSEIEKIISVESTRLQDRSSLQKKLISDFYRKSKQ